MKDKQMDSLSGKSGQYLINKKDIIVNVKIEEIKEPQLLNSSHPEQDKSSGDSQYSIFLSSYNSQVLSMLNGKLEIN